MRRKNGSLLHGYVTALSKAGQEVLETITQSALRRMWIVKVRNSLYRRSGQRTSCFVPGSTPGVPILRKEILPNTNILSETLCRNAEGFVVL